jgi:sulfoxide reductase heme-binding subunit YedZ
LSRRGVVLLKAAVWAACLTPLAWLAWRWRFGDGLGSNPIEALTLWSGKSTLVILLATLAVTPVRRLTRWNAIQKVRRLTGLFAFFYATLHLSVYLVLDQFFAWSYIWEDVAERPFITAGAAAFLCLLALALTSTRGWIRRLGRNWVRLHRLVYVAAPLAVLHYFWKQKADFRDPLIAVAVLAVLFAVRVGWWLMGRARARVRASAAAGSSRAGERLAS